jgi:hypothetical protein
VLRAGLAQTHSKPLPSLLLPIKPATLISTNPAKAARTVNDPPNHPQLPDDQLIQILKESIQEMDDVDCSTLLTLMSVAKSLSQLEQAAALVVSKMKLSSAKIAGPTPNLARLRNWCSYMQKMKETMRDFERLCFHYTDYTITAPGMLLILPKFVVDERADLSQSIMNALYNWHENNLDRPAFMMRKMADIMMSQYMSMQRIDSINYKRSDNPQEPRWGQNVDASEYSDRALDTMAIDVFKRYVELQSTWKTSPNSATTATDILYVCETLKVLPWMDYAMTAEEFGGSIPAPYALNPWSLRAKHPIRLATINASLKSGIRYPDYYSDFAAWVKLTLVDHLRMKPGGGTLVGSPVSAG